MPELTIIRGMIIKSADEFLKDGAVVVQDDKIIDVDDWDKIDKNYSSDTIIGSENHIVLPGFVNTHSHAVQTFFRGAADDLELLDWLEEVILPGEATLTEDELYASCRIGYAEMIKSGITTTNDMLTANHAESGLQAALDSGIRGLVGKMLMDRNVPDGLMGDTDEIIEEAITLAKKYPSGGRIEYAFTPRFIPTCSDKLMMRASHEASKRDLMLHTHAAENRSECEWVEELHTDSYIHVLDSLGCTGNHVILAHCVWTSEKERDILESTQTNISHNPSSNSKLASGIAPVSDYIERGISVGLGTDGSPATGGHDFFLEMRLASFLQKVTDKDPTKLPARTVFRMATEIGATTLQKKDIGRIQPGYKADICILNPTSSSAFPMYNPYSYIVYTASKQDIDYVMIDGSLVVKDSELVYDMDDFYMLAEQYKDLKPYKTRPLGK